jgi:DNA-directed RNA polymerase specialized sigma24 family protein
MPITPADEQLLQAVFDWARRLFRRKGLTEHDAEDCAAEVRLPMLAHLKQGRTLSFAYAVRVAQGVLADFVQAQQRQHRAFFTRGGGICFTTDAIGGGHGSICVLVFLLGLSKALRSSSCVGC